MSQIRLHDDLYERALRRATEAGFESVDAYVAEVIGDDLREENFDHLFTPERIAHLDRISREVREGAKTYTMEEVEARLQKTRAAWQSR
jgi:hypothetical protein